MTTFAKWFMAANNLSTPAGKFDREEVLGFLYKPLFVSIDRSSEGTIITAVQCAEGRAILTPFTEQGCELIDVDFIFEARAIRAKFWMNKSSLSDLGDVLRKAPRKSAEDILVGA